MRNIMIKFIKKKSGARNIHCVVDIQYFVVPGPPVRPGHPLSPLPSSHDFSDRIGFFRELLVMATLSKVLFC